MKQFATILFVLIFVLAGNSRAQDLSQNKIGCNFISFTNGNQTCQNPIVCDDFYLEGQDTNEPDGLDIVSVLPDSFHINPQSEIRSFAVVFPFYQIMQISELFLDLPPPLLSV